MRTLLTAMVLGLIVGGIVPAEFLLNASAEMIAFVTLLMAGLIPAMILTATALRGDTLSAARVREFGDRLRNQLRFWAALFLLALVSVLFISAAKVAADSPIALLYLPQHTVRVPTIGFQKAFLAIGFGSLGGVLARLLPAYRGLQSLLTLNVGLAERQALANDRSLEAGLGSKAARLAAAVSTKDRVEWPK